MTTVIPCFIQLEAITSRRRSLSKAIKVGAFHPNLCRTSRSVPLNLRQLLRDVEAFKSSCSTKSVAYLLIDLKQLLHNGETLLIGASVHSRINQPEVITSRRRSLSKAHPGASLPYVCIANYPNTVNLKKSP